MPAQRPAGQGLIYGDGELGRVGPLMHQAALRQANDFTHGGIINHAKFQHRGTAFQKCRSLGRIDAGGGFHNGAHLIVGQAQHAREDKPP